MRASNHRNQVRLGVIGLGRRGKALLKELAEMPDVDIPAVSSRNDVRLQDGIREVEAAGRRRPEGYSDYADLLARDDIEGVIIAADWSSSAEIALHALQAGKYAGFEVCGAASLEQCWALVRTSEETGIPCMMLENCCYGRNEMALLNMVKQGIFGELIHCQGGYQHDLRAQVAQGMESGHYRLPQYTNRNGDLYPSHGLGPLAKYLHINNGNRFLTLTSMSSKSRGVHNWAREHLGRDHPVSKASIAQGDIVTTMIRCAGGETILLTLDTTLPRPYSRGGRVQGTKGIWMEDNDSIYLEGRSVDHAWEPFEPYRGQFEHPLWKEFLEIGIRGGHDGMDYVCLRAFIESIKTNSQTPIDVYDSAAWMAVTVLSEQSAALGGAPVAIPDFTSGRWINRVPCPDSKYAL
ncbi:MAG: Alpha-N-acetylgalactosaminidase [Paenibacillus sp.]|nr:Alpha-N-acetylgalactosaminidase [Paenibacillus sp.]